MPLPVVDITSWDAFITEVSTRVNNARSDQFCFRGQSNFEWTLEPLMLRLLRNKPDFSPSEAHRIEEEITEEFVSSNASELKSKCGPDVFSKWALMQHFGAPTRLLDWTFSAFIGAYFAVQEPWMKDGAIWFFDRVGLRLQNERFLKTPTRKPTKVRAKRRLVHASGPRMAGKASDRDLYAFRGPWNAFSQ